jgi:hypothetical protein
VGADVSSTVPLPRCPFDMVHSPSRRRSATSRCAMSECPSAKARRRPRLEPVPTRRVVPDGAEQRLGV